MRLDARDQRSQTMNLNGSMSQCIPSVSRKAVNGPGQTGQDNTSGDPVEKPLSVPGGNSKPALAFAHWFVTGIFFLIRMDDGNRTVRFHALQRIPVSPALVVAVFVPGFVPLAGPVHRSSPIPAWISRIYFRRRVTYCSETA